MSPIVLSLGDTECHIDAKFLTKLLRRAGKAIYVNSLEIIVIIIILPHHLGMHKILFWFPVNQWQ